jgi:hypothetical protein
MRPGDADGHILSKGLLVGPGDCSESGATGIRQSKESRETSSDNAVDAPWESNYFTTSSASGKSEVALAVEGGG